jgi:phage shock protein C
MTTTGGEGPPEEHVLRKSRDDRVVAGVCGGLARYFGIDSTLVRLAFVLLVFAGGGGILVYLVALVLMPAERPGEHVSGPPDRERLQGVWFFVGVALIALGGVLLLGELFSWFRQYIGPALLIAIGVGILVHAARR